MRGSAPLLNAGLSPLIAIAMDIRPRPRSPPNRMACFLVPYAQRDTPRAACAIGELIVELQIFGRYTAVSIYQDTRWSAQAEAYASQRLGAASCTPTGLRFQQL
jgi:hypothetical protein